jgi:transcriptional regulator with PAS, ATPase and Fis domain
VVPIDVRLLCSTNRSLKQMVAAGEFRADLYYRINTMEITVPPLRERIEDIPLLTDHFIRSANKRNGLAVSGMHARLYPLLSAYSWPGNIQELRNTVERVMVLCPGDLVTEQDLSIGDYGKENGGAQENEDKPFDLQRKLNETEYRYLQQAYQRHGNVRAAAKSLGMDPSTFARRKRKLGELLSQK